MKKNINLKMVKLPVFLLTLFCLSLLAGAAQARDVTFSWAANVEAIDGYRLYYKTGVTGGAPYNGTGILEGTSPINIGEATTITLHGLSDTDTYHFTLTAYSGSVESGYSAEITLFPLSTDLSAIFTWSVPQTSSPLTVTFDGTPSTGSISSYSWNFNDGSPVNNSAAPSHTFPTAGTYQVKLTVENATGDNSSVTKEITLRLPTGDNQPPSADLVITSAPAGEAPLSVSFDASGSSDPENSLLTFSWDFGDGATGTGPAPTHLYTTAGNYAAKVTVTDNQGASDRAESQLIVVTAGSSSGSPTVIITANRTVGAAPMLVGLTGTATTPNGIITAYKWSFGDGSTGFGREAYHIFTVPGSYTAQLTVTDSSGQQAAATKTITVTSQGSESITRTLVEIYKLLLLSPAAKQTAATAAAAAVTSSADDAEEVVSSGAMNLTSTDLEMTMENQEQLVGLRFNLLAVPQNAIITRAWIQFTVDKPTSSVTRLNIEGEATGYAEPFNTAPYNISSRYRTGSTVVWEPPTWSSSGAAGPDQQTAALTRIVQEIVSRNDWASGNAMAFIISGDGQRVARSYDDTSAGAAVLHVEFITNR